MRALVRFTGLGLGLALLAGCADTPLVPADSEVEPSGAMLSEVAAEDEYQVERLRLNLEGWADERTLVPLHLVTPEAARNIGTGSALVITIPNEGRFGCTANFVWAEGGKRYLGSAGHCFLPGDRTATHGEGADYDASGVKVEVCVEDCAGNFRSNLLVGTWVTLGKVVYARQQNTEGRGVGHDFGVVAIPKEFQDLVRIEMPVWGGPTGIEELELGAYGCHYGNGVLVGETFLTKARVGVGGGHTTNYWAGDFAGAFGDSGSGLVTCQSDGSGFHGTGAAGVLTHLGIRLNPDTGEHGVILGTTMQRSIQMAKEAHLHLTLLQPK